MGLFQTGENRALSRFLQGPFQNEPDFEGGLHTLEQGRTRGFPKTSVFGKAALDLTEKAGFVPLSP
jgi:hypothetical protein